MRPTFEGWATTLTALVALLAAVVAYRGIMKQIDAEKKAREDERAARTRAIATALMAEVNDFYVFFLRGLHEQKMVARVLQNLGLLKLLEGTQAPEFGPVPPTAFIVYKSVAPQLGTLSMTTVRSVVSLYNFMSTFIEHYEIYRQVWSPSSVIDDDVAIKLMDVVRCVPELILDSYGACERLEADGGEIPKNPDFITSSVRRAGENGHAMLDILRDEAARVREFAAGPR